MVQNHDSNRCNADSVDSAESANHDSNRCNVDSVESAGSAYNENNKIGSLVKLVIDAKFPPEVKFGIIISIETILTENMLASYSNILMQKDFIIQLGEILNTNPNNKEYIFRLAQKIAKISSDAKTLISKSIGICEEYIDLGDTVGTFQDEIKNDIKVETKDEAIIDNSSNFLNKIKDNSILDGVCPRDELELHTEIKLEPMELQVSDGI